MESSTEVPEVIAHLDFDPEEKKERAKVCDLSREHEHDAEQFPCGRPAYVQVTITDKPCGHKDKTMYICKGCWTAVELDPQRMWKCYTCAGAYVVKKHLKRWERI